MWKYASLTFLLSFPGGLLVYANLNFDVESLSVSLFSRCIVFNM